MRKRFGRLALVGVILVVAGAPALAQDRRSQLEARFAARRQMSLLNQKSVQEELKLSEEQLKKVKEMNDTRRGGFGNIRQASEEERKKLADRSLASERAVIESLKPEQFKRLKQIALQERGASALGDAEIATALKLTDEQKTKVKEIQDRSREEMRGAGRGEEALKKREELRKSTNEKLMNVLTAEQKTKLKALTGEPFKGEIVRPWPGGPRPGGEGRRPGRDR